MTLMLGTWLKEKSRRLGIKPCSSCEQRARKLDEWSRRGFIRTLTIVGFSMKARLIHEFVLREDNSPALSLCRAINTIQLNFFNQSGDDGIYGAKADVWGTEGLYGIQQRHKTEESDTGRWARSLTLESDNIMPGWTVDYASKPNGYVVLVAAISQDATTPRAVYSTDHDAVIYRTDFSGNVPKASSLGSADSLPNATSFDLWIGDERTTVFSRLLLSLGIPTKVLAQGCTAGSCCECCYAWGGVCVTKKPGIGTCAFNCGTQSVCPWCVTGQNAPRCCPYCCNIACGCGAGGGCNSCTTKDCPA